MKSEWRSEPNFHWRSWHPEGEPLTVHQLKPAWSRVFLCRYILRLRARIRELEAELAKRDKQAAILFEHAMEREPMRVLDDE